jgi:hypothetical protein
MPGIQVMWKSLILTGAEKAGGTALSRSSAATRMNERTLLLFIHPP